MTRIISFWKLDQDAAIQGETSIEVTEDQIAAYKAARAYQLCLIAGFALPAIGLLATAFLA